MYCHSVSEPNDPLVLVCAGVRVYPFINVADSIYEGLDALRLELAVLSE